MKRPQPRDKDDAHDASAQNCHASRVGCALNHEIRSQLTDVTVENSPRGGEQRIRQNGTESTEPSRTPANHAPVLLSVGVAVIGHQLSHGSQSILEPDQAFIVQVGAAKVNLVDSSCLSIFDQLPE